MGNQIEPKINLRTFEAVKLKKILLSI